MKTKVSWELLDRGSLRLRIISGDRDVSWTIAKTADLDRVYNVLEEMQIEINRNRRYVNPDYTFTEEDWKPKMIPMNETVRTVEDDELRLLESMKSLADKADSVKLDGRDFWGASDMDELDLYVLGTGEPE